MSFPAAAPGAARHSFTAAGFLLAGVALGSLSWYCGFSTAIAVARGRLGPRLLRVVDVGSGGGLLRVPRDERLTGASRPSRVLAGGLTPSGRLGLGTRFNPRRQACVRVVGCCAGWSYSRRLRLAAAFQSGASAARKEPSGYVACIAGNITTVAWFDAPHVLSIRLYWNSYAGFSFDTRDRSGFFVAANPTGATSATMVVEGYTKRNGGYTVFTDTSTCVSCAGLSSLPG